MACLWRRCSILLFVISNQCEVPWWNDLAKACTNGSMPIAIGFNSVLDHNAAVPFSLLTWEIFELNLTQTWDMCISCHLFYQLKLNDTKLLCDKRNVNVITDESTVICCCVYCKFKTMFSIRYYRCYQYSTALPFSFMD